MDITKYKKNMMAGGNGSWGGQEEETVDKDIIETHEGRLRHKGSNKQRTRTGKQELKMTK